MDAESIDAIGQAAYARGILPKKKSTVSAAEIVGFDTEYVSATGELLCVTLSSGDRTGFHEIASGEKLTPRKLVSWCRELGVESTRIVLVSYFSLAELQHLPVAKKAVNWREYGRSFDCSFVVGATVVRVYDLSRFFERSSLASVAKVFGMEKLEWHREGVARHDLTRPSFKAYAVRDAIIAERVFRALRAEFMSSGVDIVVAATPARAASDVFRTQLTDPITNEEHRARYCGLRAAWGGRSEVFRRGRFPALFEYDMPSAYPRAVVELGELPAGKDWREVKSWRELEKCVGGVAFASWEWPKDEQYPSLPTVHRGRMMYFSKGAEHVTFAELRAAREQGATIRLLEAWGYRSGDRRLSEWMRHLLDAREKAEGPRKVMLKLLANALIGKLAQRSRRLDLEKLWRHCEETGESFRDLVQLTPEELQVMGFDYGYSVGSCYAPEWNALVCGLVRAKVSAAVREHQAVYVATDAFWTVMRLPDAPAGFQLKREGPGVIARSKLATIGEHVVHFGIHGREDARALARRMLESDQEIAEYIVRRPLRPQEALSKGVAIGRWISESRRASIAWDQKRKLGFKNHSRPWMDAREFDTHNPRR